MTTTTRRKAPDMTKAPSKEQSRYDAALEAREQAALEELQEIGFRIGVYEPRSYLEQDELRGIAGGWRVGTCYAVADSVDGKRKTISAMSAVDACDQAKAWLHYQETRLAPELRFDIAKGQSVAMPVIQRLAGDTAETAARRAATERRIISLDSGTAQLVDAHGEPIEDISRASQFRDASQEERSPT